MPSPLPPRLEVTRYIGLPRWRDEGTAGNGIVVARVAVGHHGRRAEPTARAPAQGGRMGAVEVARPHPRARDRRLGTHGALRPFDDDCGSALYLGLPDPHRHRIVDRG